MLRTHSPLNPSIATRASFDLHVLSTPPAFILSQDQTLRMTSTSLPEGGPVYVWRLVIDCRVHDPAVGSTVPPKWNDHPKLLTMVLSSYHSSVVKVPLAPRLLRRQSGADITTPRCCCQERHKNRCKHIRSHRPSFRLSLAQLFGLSVAGAADKLTCRYYIPALSRLSTFARQNQLGAATRSTMAPGWQGESFKWAC